MVRSDRAVDGPRRGPPSPPVTRALCVARGCRPRFEERPGNPRHLSSLNLEQLREDLRVFIGCTMLHMFLAACMQLSIRCRTRSTGQKQRQILSRT